MFLEDTSCFLTLNTVAWVHILTQFLLYIKGILQGGLYIRQILFFKISEGTINGMENDGKERNDENGEEKGRRKWDR